MTSHQLDLTDISMCCRRHVQYTVDIEWHLHMHSESPSDCQAWALGSFVLWYLQRTRTLGHLSPVLLLSMGKTEANEDEKNKSHFQIDGALCAKDHYLHLDFCVLYSMCGCDYILV